MRLTSRLLALSSTLLISPALAQIEPVWQTDISGPPGLITSITASTASTHGGVLIAVRQLELTTGASEARIRRLDPNGNITADFSVGSAVTSFAFAAVTALAEDEQGTLYVGLSGPGGPYLRCLDSGGQPLWSVSRPFGTASVRAASIQPLPDGGCIAVGNSDSGRVARFGSDGTQLWQQTVGCSNCRSATDAQGNTFVVGPHPAFFTTPSPLVTARIDAAGSMTPWFQSVATWDTLTFVPNDIVVDSRGHVHVLLADLFGGAQLLVSYDRAGGLNWTDAGQLQASGGGFLSLAADDFGNVRVGGYDSGFGGVRVMRFGPGGTLDWDVGAPLIVASEGPVRGFALAPRGRAYLAGLAEVPGGTRPFLFTVHPGGTSSELALGPQTYAGSDFAPPGSWPVLEMDDGHPVLPWYVPDAGGDPDDTRTVMTRWVRGGPQGSPVCTPGEANSTGVPGRLRALGSSIASFDDLTLVADSLPPNVFVLMLTGSPSAPVPFPGATTGTLCVASSPGRYVLPGQIQLSNAEGRATLHLDLDLTPTPFGFTSVLAGESRVFQAWHRDVNGSLLYGFTEAVEVAFN